MEEHEVLAIDLDMLFDPTNVEAQLVTVSTRAMQMGGKWSFSG